MSRQEGRPPFAQGGHDRLRSRFAAQIAKVEALAQANGELAEARKTILELREEAQGLRDLLTALGEEKAAVERSLQQTAEIARGYARQVDFLERRSRKPGFLRRLLNPFAPTDSATTETER